MRKYVLIGIFVMMCCSVVLLSGCDLSMAASPATLPLLHQVVMVDTAPQLLDVKVTINEDQNASDGKVQIIVQFSASNLRNTNDVQLLDKEMITCNNVPLSYNTDMFSYTASILSTSNNYNCTYVSKGRRADISVPIQSQLAPTFSISHTKLVVNYVAGNSRACRVQVDALDNVHTINGPSQPDTGQYTNLNIQDLSGAGKLRITRLCTTIEAPAFHASTVAYQATRTVDVTWKQQ